MQTIILSAMNNLNYITKQAKKEETSNFFFKKISEQEIEFYSEDYEILQLKIAEVLSDYIIEFEEENLLKKILHSDYPFFTSSEKNKILFTANQIIKNNENDFLRMLILLKRRFLIKQSILEYLSENTYMDLTGFIVFRLGSYKKMLIELIQKVIDDYKLQKEYKEFIDMLKFFVETQKNRMEKIHVIFEENGEYVILDSKSKDITKACFEEFLETKEQNNLNNEDVLISSLITLAPKKLFLHFEDEKYNRKIVNTIEQIFENKVYISSEPLLEVVR